MTPEIILPPPFPYQEYQIGKIVTRHHTAVISPPGSGKTRAPIEALARLGLVSAGNVAATLIVCSGPAIGTWKWQFPYWTGQPELAQHIHVVRGKPEYRRQLWRQAKETRKGIYVTNSSIFLRDYELIMAKDSYKDKPGGHWAALLADEYHKYMRRKTSQVFKAFATIARNIDVVVPMTGSVLNKDPSSMWTVFHLCDPDHPLFRGYWKFAKTFCYVDDSGFGQRVHGVRNVERLKEFMDEYLGFVPREVVADQLPGGNRRKLPVEMTPPQEKAYRKIATEMMYELADGGLVVAPTVLSKMIILRKILCMPKMVDPALDYGGGFEAIAERLEEQPHAAIFVPFREACTWVREGLKKCGHKNVFVLRGGVNDTEQAEIVAEVKKTKGILVCTIAYAESFDLETCDTSYFLGYEYDPNQNQQAEGRTQRAISTFENVWWHYVLYMDTVDEDLMENVNQGYQVVRKVLSRSDEMLRMLKGQKS